MPDITLPQPHVELRVEGRVFHIDAYCYGMSEHGDMLSIDNDTVLEIGSQACSAQVTEILAHSVHGTGAKFLPHHAFRKAHPHRALYQLNTRDAIAAAVTNLLHALHEGRI